MSEGETIPIRTFHNHRKAIEDIFDINIECERRNGYCYYIENVEDIEKNDIKKWLLNTFAVNNIINENHLLKKRILLENIPSGEKYLIPMIEAMRCNRVVTISYQSFWKKSTKTFDIEPYCLKIFRQRWYVLARSCRQNDLLVFSLDRISSIHITEQSFSLPDDFDAQEFFPSCFGIIVAPAKKLETVRLIVYRHQHKFLRPPTLPHRQRHIKTHKAMGFQIFAYPLSPLFDFVKEILSYGDEIEVESPSWLRDVVANITRNAGMLYRE